MSRKRKQYTKEQKAEHFHQVRQQWAAAKAAAEGNQDTEALFAHLSEMGIAGVSKINIMLVQMQAAELGLKGTPYIDFKPYRLWRRAGFQVRRGEKSPVYSITWINGSKKDDDEADDGRRWPKVTHLFHTSQVDPIITI